MDKVEVGEMILNQCGGGSRFTGLVSKFACGTGRHQNVFGCIIYSLQCSLNFLIKTGCQIMAGSQVSKKDDSVCIQLQLGKGEAQKQHTKQKESSSTHWISQAPLMMQCFNLQRLRREI